MDKSNLSNVTALAKTEEDLKKVDLLLNVSKPDSDNEVPDPYYGGEEGFENVFQLVWEACEKLALNSK